ncbi:hypothetical protein BDW62DRAFT_159876 [Aspergillus aurantiobrunneus]
MSCLLFLLLSLSRFTFRSLLPSSPPDSSLCESAFPGFLHWFCSIDTLSCFLLPNTCRCHCYQLSRNTRETLYTFEFSYSVA